MARNRMIKPEFWDDEKLVTISRDARLLYIGMWNFSDDYGVVKGNHEWLKNRIFPYEKLSLEEFSRWVKEIEDMKRILHFISSGESFFFIKNFKKYQTINHVSKTRNPEPPVTLTEDYGSTTVALPHESNISIRESNISVMHEEEQKTSTQKTSRKASPLIPIPDNFGISERVIKWAKSKGHTKLEEHLENFKLSALSKNYKYADWDSAFMRAIRDNWAKIYDAPKKIESTNKTTGMLATMKKEAEISKGGI